MQAPIAAPACQTEHCGRLQTESLGGCSWLPFKMVCVMLKMWQAPGPCGVWLCKEDGREERIACKHERIQYWWKTLGCEITFVEIFPELTWWKTQHENVGRRVVCIEALLWLVLESGNLVSLVPSSVFWGLDTWQPTRQFQDVHH